LRLAGLLPEFVRSGSYLFFGGIWHCRALRYVGQVQATGFVPLGALRRRPVVCMRWGVGFRVLADAGNALGVPFPGRLRVLGELGKVGAFSKRREEPMDRDTIDEVIVLVVASAGASANHPSELMGVGRRREMKVRLNTEIDDGRNELEAQRATAREVEAWDMARRVAFCLRLSPRTQR
jgi:hypothetical protein